MAYRLNADLRALELVYSNVEVPIAPPNNLIQTLLCLVEKVRTAQSSPNRSGSNKKKIKILNYFDIDNIIGRKIK